MTVDVAVSVASALTAAALAASDTRGSTDPSLLLLLLLLVVVFILEMTRLVADSKFNLIRITGCRQEGY